MPSAQASIDIIDRAVAELDEKLDRWLSSGRLARRGVTHGDLNARNLIFRDRRLVGIIDTDDCRVEPLIWDVAQLAYRDPGVSPEQVWDDYLAAGGPLDPTDVELLEAFARIGALSEARWLTGDDGNLTHFVLRQLSDLAVQVGP